MVTDECEALHRDIKATIKGVMKLWLNKIVVIFAQINQTKEDQGIHPMDFPLRSQCHSKIFNLMVFCPEMWFVFYFCMHVCMHACTCIFTWSCVLCVRMSLCVCVCGLRIICRNQFSPSTIWILRIKLWLPDSTALTFPHLT